MNEETFLNAKKSFEKTLKSLSLNEVPYDSAIFSAKYLDFELENIFTLIIFCFCLY